MPSLTYEDINEPTPEDAAVICFILDHLPSALSEVAYEGDLQDAEIMRNMEGLRGSGWSPAEIITEVMFVGG